MSNRQTYTNTDTNICAHTNTCAYKDIHLRGKEWSKCGKSTQENGECRSRHKKMCDEIIPNEIIIITEIINE